MLQNSSEQNFKKPKQHQQQLQNTINNNDRQHQQPTTSHSSKFKKPSKIITRLRIQYEEFYKQCLKRTHEINQRLESTNKCQLKKSLSMSTASCPTRAINISATLSPPVPPSSDSFQRSSSSRNLMFFQPLTHHRTTLVEVKCALIDLNFAMTIAPNTAIDVTGALIFLSRMVVESTFYHRRSDCIPQMLKPQKTIRSPNVCCVIMRQRGQQQVLQLNMNFFRLLWFELCDYVDYLLSLPNIVFEKRINIQFTRSYCLDLMQHLFPCELVEIPYQWLNSVYDYVYSRQGLNILRQDYLAKTKTGFEEPLQILMLRIAYKFSRRRILQPTMPPTSVSQQLQQQTSFNYNSHQQPQQSFHQQTPTSNILQQQLQTSKQTPPLPSSSLSVSNSPMINKLASVSLQKAVPVQTNTYTYETDYDLWRLLYNLFACGHMQIDSKLLYDDKQQQQLANHNPCNFVHIHDINVLLVIQEHSTTCGVKLTNYFMSCVSSDKPWYLFQHHHVAHLEGLADDAYTAAYKTLVSEKKFLFQTMARSFFNDLIATIHEHNNVIPIFFADNILRYTEPSVLLQDTKQLCQRTVPAIYINVTGAYQFEKQNLEAWQFVKVNCHIPGLLDVIVSIRYEASVVRYAFAMGFIATWALNNLPQLSGQRHIAVSAMGVYDLAMRVRTGPANLVPSVGEFLYLGAVAASISYTIRYQVYCENFHLTTFSLGKLQFDLQNQNPYTPVLWDHVRPYMKQGMANASLIADFCNERVANLYNISPGYSLPVNLIEPNGNNLSYGICAAALLRPSDELNTLLDRATQQRIQYIMRLFTDHIPQTHLVCNEWSTTEIQLIIQRAYMSRLRTAFVKLQRPDDRSKFPGVLEITSQPLAQSPSMHKMHRPRIAVIQSFELPS